MLKCFKALWLSPSLLELSSHGSRSREGLDEIRKSRKSSSQGVGVKLLVFIFIVVWILVCLIAFLRKKQ